MIKPTISQIEEFLFAVDHLFPVRLSQKQNLHDFAMKLYHKATICCVIVEDKIVAMVGGYTENLADNISYISVVATLPAFQGKGYAKGLLGEFIGICQEKELSGIHLYTSRTNLAAKALYKSWGFQEWNCQNEPRPDDLHLICILKE